MKLSTRARYGLRAMIDLALRADGEAVSIQSIAARQEISECYLEQLAGKLRKAGLITSLRGAGGGYQLARPAETISVGEILRVLEGSLEAVDCPGLKEEKGSCHQADSCLTKIVWKRINEGIINAVDTLMLSDLVNQMAEGDGKAGICQEKERPIEKIS